MGEREATWQGKGRLFQTYGASWPDVKKLDNVQKTENDAKGVQAMEVNFPWDLVGKSV